MEMLATVSELMPAGKPTFLEVIKFPKIEVLAKEIGAGQMRKVLFLMLKDFCNSMNVVRNMNEDQLIEGAIMLLNECGNFRLEDYAMMFAMAKKGELYDIRDRIDLQILSSIIDNYWTRRHRAAENAEMDAVKHLETIGDTTRQIENLPPEQAKLIQAGEKLAAAFEGWKDVVKK